MFKENTPLNSVAESTEQKQYLQSESKQRNIPSDSLATAIDKVKYELRNNKKHILIEKIKNIIM